MAKKRRLQGASAALAALPTGAVLVGKLVAALGLPADAADSKLQGKTAHRYFSGERIEDEKIVEIFAAIGNVFVDLGFAPPSGWRPSRGLAPARRAGLAVHHLVTCWDATLGALRGDVLRGVASKLVALAAARLLVVDIALRAAAWLALVGIVLDEADAASPPPETSAILSKLVERTTLSREEVARRCKVKRTTVDDWVHGARITDDNLSNLVLIVGDEREADVALGCARRELATAAVLTQLRAYFGTDYGDQVDELWRGLALLTVRFSRFMAQSRLLGEERFEPPGNVLEYGTSSRPALFVLNNSLKQGTQADWAAVLEVGPAWSEYLVHAACVARSAGRAAERTRFGDDVEHAASLLMLNMPRHHVPKVPPGWVTVRIESDNETKASNRLAQFHPAFMRGDYDEAITHARRAAELTPQSWPPHFALGAVLGIVGHVAEGIAECEIAAQLATLPEDIEKAKVEIGIILTNVDRHEEACAHLENLFAAATDASVHLLYNLGVVRMRCRMFETALDAFKLVLAKEQHHPRALDLAAHCTFVLGDRRAGIAYAKQANLVGEHETYNAWRMGMYEPRKKGHG